MSEVKLGRVAPIYKGVYDETAAYNALDIVYYNGRSYIAKQDTKGNALPTGTDNDYWGLIVDKGPQGPKGDKGDTGAQGKQGSMGPAGDQGPKGDKGDKGDTPEYAQNLIINSDFNVNRSTGYIDGWDYPNTANSSASYFVNSGPYQNTSFQGMTINSTGYSDRLYSRLHQKVYINSQGTSSENITVTLQWESYWITQGTYFNLWIRGYDNQGVDTIVNDIVNSNTPYGYDSGTKEESKAIYANWVTNTKEPQGKSSKKYITFNVPANTEYVDISIESREGNEAYITKPMLTIGDKPVSYVAGPYGLKGDKGDMGQYIANQIINSEFMPNLDGWIAESTDNNMSIPYMSYVPTQSDLLLSSASVGFNTLKSPEKTYARLKQVVRLTDSGNGRRMSLSWRPYNRQTSNYNNLWIKFMDSSMKPVYNSTGKDLTYNWCPDIDTGDGWKLHKYENIEIPDSARWVTISFEAREGSNVYLTQPNLTFNNTVGPYAPNGRGAKGDTGAKGDKGEPGNTTLDSSNSTIEFKKPIYTHGEVVNTLSGTNTYNLDTVNYVKYKGSKILVAAGRYYLYAGNTKVTPGTILSYGVDVQSITAASGTNWNTSVQFYDSNNSYVTGSYTKNTGSTDWTHYKLENIVVPDKAVRAIVRFHPDGETILRISRPMLSVGATEKTYTTDSTNLIANSQLDDGLDNWYAGPNADVPADASSMFIQAESKDETYKVELFANLRGTLPDGIMNEHVMGGYLKIQGASDNGVGGITETLVTQGRCYQRQYTTEWTPWKFIQAAYGSFDDAGVYHSLHGDIVQGGVVYNQEDDSFYALAEDGKPYTTTGWQNLPVGNGRATREIKLLEGGVISDDIVDGNVATKYIDRVNSYIDKASSSASIHVVVSDTHGTSYNNLLRAHNELMSGLQFVHYKPDILENTVYVDKENIDALDGRYYYAIARKWTNRSAKNIKRIAAKFNRSIDMYSHTGDVEDGRNATIEDERQAYIEAASTFKDEHWNIIDGNHDEQLYKYETAQIHYKDGSYPNTGVDAVTTYDYAGRSRPDVQRWKESYGQDSSYFEKRDDAHKVSYIYLDTFEGGKVKYASGYTQPEGVLIGSGKVTAKQLQWLVDTLMAIPDNYSVVINSHHTPVDKYIGKNPCDSDDWWRNNINQDVLAGIINAFQDGTKYVGSSTFTGLDKYDMSAYQANITADFTGKQANRVALWNYGHFHRVGHTSKADNGRYNMIQNPNMLGQDWGYIGDARSSQFSTEIIDPEKRTVTVIRFASSRSGADTEFTLDY